jgi:hypothetical protein
MMILPLLSDRLPDRDGRDFYAVGNRLHRPHREWNGQRFERAVARLAYFPIAARSSTAGKGSDLPSFAQAIRMRKGADLAPRLAFGLPRS